MRLERTSIRVAALAPGKAMDSLTEPGSWGGQCGFSDGCWPLTLVACVLLDPWPSMRRTAVPTGIVVNSPSDTIRADRLSAYGLPVIATLPQSTGA